MYSVFRHLKVGIFQKHRGSPVDILLCGGIRCLFLPLVLQDLRGLEAKLCLTTNGCVEVSHSAQAPGEVGALAQLATPDEAVLYTLVRVIFTILLTCQAAVPDVQSDEKSRWDSQHALVELCTAASGVLDWVGRRLRHTLKPSVLKKGIPTLRHLVP